MKIWDLIDIIKSDWTRVTVQYSILGWTILDEKSSISYVVNQAKAMRIVALIKQKASYTRIELI